MHEYVYIWATSKSTQQSTIVWVKLVLHLLLGNALKLNFEHIEQVKKLSMVYHGMHWTPWYRSKLLVTWKGKDFTTRGFKRFWTHYNTLKPTQFQKCQPTYCKTACEWRHLL